MLVGAWLKTWETPLEICRVLFNSFLPDIWPCMSRGLVGYSSWDHRRVGYDLATKQQQWYLFGWMNHVSLTSSSFWGALRVFLAFHYYRQCDNNSFSFKKRNSRSLHSWIKELRTFFFFHWLSETVSKWLTGCFPGCCFVTATLTVGAGQGVSGLEARQTGLCPVWWPRARSLPLPVCCCCSGVWLAPTHLSPSQTPEQSI